MFEDLSAVRSTPHEKRAQAVALAVTVHLTVVAFLLATNVAAVPPISPPALPVVIFRTLPLPESASAPTPVASKPRTLTASRRPSGIRPPALVAAAPPPRRDESVVVQPVTATSEMANHAAATTASAATESIGPIAGGEVGEPRDAGEPGGDAVIRIGAGVVPPRLIHEVHPRYPEVARAVRLEGRVVVEAVVNVAGEIAEARVIEGNPMFTDAALNAARQWRFTPATVGGHPVPVWFTLVILFNLR